MAQKKEKKTFCRQFIRFVRSTLHSVETVECCVCFPNPWYGTDPLLKPLKSNIHNDEYIHRYA